jgi:hypothetical protein
LLSNPYEQYITVNACEGTRSPVLSHQLYVDACTSLTVLFSLDLQNRNKIIEYLDFKKIKKFTSYRIFEKMKSYGWLAKYE